MKEKRKTTFNLFDFPFVTKLILLLLMLYKCCHTHKLTVGITYLCACVKRTEVPQVSECGHKPHANMSFTLSVHIIVFKGNLVKFLYKKVTVTT